MLLTCNLKPEGGKEWVTFIRYGVSTTGGLFSQQQTYVLLELHKQMEIPGLAEWLTWLRVISLEPCWLVWSPSCRENLVHYPRICSWISKHFTGVRVVLGWTSPSIHHQVWAGLRSTGQPVRCDLNSVSGLVSVSWNSDCQTGGRSAVGSCRGLSYKRTSKVFMYIALCLLLSSGLPENSFVFVTDDEVLFMTFDIVYLFK
jgi:hypothetical protein